MVVLRPNWTAVCKILFGSSNMNLPDLAFARRFAALVAVSAFVASQGDYTTTQRIVRGLSGLLGIHQKTWWTYISILVWKSVEFGLGLCLDCTGTVS